MPRICSIHTDQCVLLSPCLCFAAGVQHMLQFNAAANTLRKDEEIYKVLVVDRFTKGIIGPLLKLSDLRKQGVTLVLDLENQREAIPDVPAVYFVQATVSTIAAISRDVAAGLYDTFHLNLALTCPRPLLETLASNTVTAQCVQRIAKIYDQYMSFIALEAGLFSLGIPDTYLQLNDPQAQDTQIEVCCSHFACTFGVANYCCLSLDLDVPPAGKHVTCRAQNPRQSCLQSVHLI